MKKILLKIKIIISLELKISIFNHLQLNVQINIHFYQYIFIINVKNNFSDYFRGSQTKRRAVNIFQKHNAASSYLQQNLKYRSLPGHFVLFINTIILFYFFN